MNKVVPIAKKSLGQHWLDDVDCLRAMCDAAEVSAEDTVLEIGPGLGSLTKLLVERAKQVVAIEIDEQLANNLTKNLQYHKLSVSRVAPWNGEGDSVVNNLLVMNGDILRFDLTSLPAGYKVVANIPYYLTSNLIRVLSESSNPPLVVALLVQKEVAERVAARPGNMSLLSVTAQFYWQVALGRVVEAQLFKPPPKVDSQILILKHRGRPLFPDVDPKQFFRLVRAGFAQRRKTLLNALSAGLHMSRESTVEMLTAADIAPTTRAQMLSLKQWHELYKQQQLSD